MTAAIFYAKTQMGWKETVVNEQANKDGKPFLVDDARQRLIDEVDTGLLPAISNARSVFAMARRNFLYCAVLSSMPYLPGGRQKYIVDNLQAERYFKYMVHICA